VARGRLEVSEGLRSIRVCLGVTLTGPAQRTKHSSPKDQGLSQGREIYLARAGERFSNQLDANKAWTIRFRVRRYLSKQFKGRQRAAQVRGAIDAHETGARKDASISIEISVPFFRALALGSAYFRSEISRMPNASTRPLLMPTPFWRNAQQSRRGLYDNRCDWTRPQSNRTGREGWLQGEPG